MDVGIMISRRIPLILRYDDEGDGGFGNAGESGDYSNVPRGRCCQTRDTTGQDHRMTPWWQIPAHRIPTRAVDMM